MNTIQERVKITDGTDKLEFYSLNCLFKSVPSSHCPEGLILFKNVYFFHNIISNIADYVKQLILLIIKLIMYHH